MVKHWSNTVHKLVNAPRASCTLVEPTASSPAVAAGCAGTLRRSITRDTPDAPAAGQTLVKHWSNTGQTLVKHWSNTGRALVKHSITRETPDAPAAPRTRQ